MRSPARSTLRTVQLIFEFRTPLFHRLLPHGLSLGVLLSHRVPLLSFPCLAHPSLRIEYLSRTISLFYPRQRQMWPILLYLASFWGNLGLLCFCSHLARSFSTYQPTNKDDSAVIRQLAP